jgi:hypothetical protein
MNAMHEREYLKAIYPNAKWIAKINRMGDQQVIAIYIRIKGAAQVLKETIDPEPESPDQLRLF